jgi:adenosylmethionine-8-amino-7-oxononanoate aminotransferase
MATVDDIALIQRDLHHTYPAITHGDGIYLFDDTGKRYIDGSGGSAAVTAIGHAVPEIVAAMTAQAAKVAYAPTHAFTNAAVEECARIVVERFAPAGLERVWFVSGGSEATENAVKMAIQYHRERGNGTKHVVIGRWQSYHGATFGGMAWGGNAGRKKPYIAALPAAEHIPPCHPYRCWNGCGGSCNLTCVDHLERTIKQLGAENVAAFIAEPVVGATLGAVAAAPGYFQRVREICDRHEVVFIADEVMSGFGRTGRHFAIEHWGVTPDLIACAKGIAGGYTPLGAVIARPEIVGELKQRGKSFVIGHTSSGNPLSCAVGTAVLTYVADHDLTANAADVGAHLLARFRALQERHAVIGDVRGLGLLTAIEFVADRERKTPFPVAARFARRFGQATLDRGLISYPIQGGADGEQGDHVVYAPPLTMTRAQADDLADIVDASIAATVEELTAEGYAVP